MFFLLTLQKVKFINFKNCTIVKKLLVVCGFALLGLQNASAQDDSWAPQHVAIGVGVGTTGISIDASTTFSHWLGLRAGVDIMPGIKISKQLDLKTEDANKQVSQLTSEITDLNSKLVAAGMEQINLNQYPGGNLPNTMDVQGKLKNTTGHVLVDFYPIPGFSFHITGGMYFGPSNVITVSNKESGFLQPINAYNNAIINANSSTADPGVQNVVNKYNLKMIGAELGDYFVTSNPSNGGDVEAFIKVNNVRGYAGLGIGRAVPKSRLGVQVDLGCQFWGKPKVYIPTYDKTTGTYQNEEIDPDKAGDDAGKILKVVSKFSVYPTLSIRLVGRIF